MTEGPDEGLRCSACGHAPHEDECDVSVDYDHLNGDHECGCPGPVAVEQADTLRTAIADAIREARREVWGTGWEDHAADTIARLPLLTAERERADAAEYDRDVEREAGRMQAEDLREARERADRLAQANAKARRMAMESADAHGYASNLRVADEFQAIATALSATDPGSADE